jgi:dienelactone hydrolase
MSRFTSRVLLSLALSITGSSLLAQTPEESGFVILRGQDTIAVEKFTRTPAHLEGELVDRLQFFRQTYSADIAGDKSISTMVVELRKAGNDPKAAPIQRVSMAFHADTVIAQVGTGASMQTQRLTTAPSAVPYINLSFALTEQALRHAKSLGTKNVPLFLVNGGQTVYATLASASGDSTSITIGGTELRVKVDADGRLLGGVVPSQVITVHRVGAVNTSAAPTKKDYAAPAGAPYRSENVTITTPAGHTLAGTLTLPKNSTVPVPAIVTITGSGQEDRDEALPSVLRGYLPFRQIADTLGRRGIAVLRMDDRGFGESTGNAAAATSADFADDIRAGLAYLRTRTDIDGNKLGLLGHSEGGLIAPMIAATDPRLKAMVLLAAPSITGRGILRYQNRQALEQDKTIPVAKRDSVLNASMVKIDSLGKSVPWMRFFLDYDPLAAARKVHVPVLILQGATDWQILPEQAQQLADAFRQGGNRDVTVKVFPNRNHLFVTDSVGNPAGYVQLKDDKVGAEVLGAIADWSTAHLLR